MNPPGSHYCVSRGCICGHGRNNFGVGSTDNGRYIFLVDSECPLHGRSNWGKANAEGRSVPGEDYAIGDIIAVPPRPVVD
jgi:hypothetical protein